MAAVPQMPCPKKQPGKKPAKLPASRTIRDHIGSVAKAFKLEQAEDFTFRHFCELPGFAWAVRIICQHHYSLPPGEIIDKYEV